jgi:hypothetical protein
MVIYYLYKKTHRDTGLKYLGFTKENPYSYTGSGVRWISHCEKHGYNIDTEILLETPNKNKIKETGIYYSNLWNVVKSRDWANLKPETGDGGGVPGMHKGKKRPQEHIDAMKTGWERIKSEGYRPWNYGQTGLKGPCKKITLVSPDGEHHAYESLKQGCKEQNLIYTIMSSVNNGSKLHHRGWTILNPKKQPLNRV